MLTWVLSCMRGTATGAQLAVGDDVAQVDASSPAQAEDSEADRGRDGGDVTGDVLGVGLVLVVRVMVPSPSHALERRLPDIFDRRHSAELRKLTTRQ